MSGQLAPYLTHPHMPQFHDQLTECSTELASIGDLARLYRLRLSLHPAHYIQLGSPDPERVARSQQELAAGADLFDAMGFHDGATMVIHVGGVYEDQQATLGRFVQNFVAMRPEVRARVVLENDDRHYGINDSLWVHQQTGIRLVLDVLHHHCVNPRGIPLLEALKLALDTWPDAQQPKIHLSSSRTEIRQLVRQGKVHLQMPLPQQHSDFINPFEFIDLIRNARAANLRPFDIMLEAKGKDLALLRLREQVKHFAPDLEQLIA